MVMFDNDQRWLKPKQRYALTALAAVRNAINFGVVVVVTVIIVSPDTPPTTTKEFIIIINIVKMFLRIFKKGKQTIAIYWVCVGWGLGY